MNTVDQDALRDLTITKKLYDESGQNEISYDQDQTFFNFRLYMTSEYDELDDQDLVNMHAYHVKDPDGYYCKWNASQQKFEKIGEGITNYSDLSDVQKESATFYTSVYGQISRIYR